VDLGDWGLTVDDSLLTRVMELIVHTDDLAVSLGVPTPPRCRVGNEDDRRVLTLLSVGSRMFCSPAVLRCQT
jgi:hypothetical protein